MHIEHDYSWSGGQVVQEGAAQKFLDARRRDQQKALRLLREDPSLGQATASGMLKLLEGWLAGC